MPPMPATVSQVPQSVVTPLSMASDIEIPWARIVLVLLLCIALAVAAAYFLRMRYGRSVSPSFAALLRSEAKRKPELEILERVRISPTSQICLVRCGTRRYLLHAAQQSATLIERQDDASVKVEEQP